MASLGHLVYRPNRLDLPSGCKKPIGLACLRSGEAVRIPSVGAFGLAPGGKPEQRGAISAFLKCVFELVSGAEQYLEEGGYFRASWKASRDC
jgi:hypothetical protein